MHCPFEKCQDAKMTSVRHCQEGQKHGGAHKAAASCSFASEPRSFKLSFVAELLLAAARQQGHDGEEKQLCSRHNLSPANREGKSNTAATCWKELSQKEYTQSLPCWDLLHASLWEGVNCSQKVFEAQRQCLKWVCKQGAGGINRRVKASFHK